ncbi:MAG: hypothetical protein LUC93_03285 [Planctomycetaceae bacterium]|nr:hypothetical protein [Planctomycetaceae bacterium]
MASRDDIIQALTEYRNDPVLWCRDIIKLEPTAQQKEFLTALAQPGARVAVRSGHGTGKSTALAAGGLWFVSTRKDALVPCTAPTAHQLQDVLWREYRRLLNRMNDFWRGQFSVNADRITRGSSMVVGRTARPENPDALQGFHAPEILFEIEEAAGVAEPIFEVARGALSTPSARVALAGNPTRLTGYFHNAFHGARDTWTRLQFSCLDSPLVDPSYATDIAAEYGEDSDMYRVRVLGDFPKAGLYNLISLDLVERAMATTLPLHSQDHAPIIIGVDPAWLGTDRSVAVLRQGMLARVLFAVRGVDTVKLADLVARRAEQERPDAIFVDQTGVGAGVYDQLRRTGQNVVGIAFSQSPIDTDRFVNKRIEMWWNMKEWLEQGPALEQNNDLRDDLIGPEYFHTNTGKMQLESKDDMRKRGLASPDLGDALALTFARPVHKRQESAFRDMPPGPEPRFYDWMERH